jgi:hypothetical protein
MKVLYTVTMPRRHMDETELLTRMVKDTVKSFNLLMLANARLEPARFVTNEFNEVGPMPTFRHVRHRFTVS